MTQPLRIVVNHPADHRDARPFREALARFGDRVTVRFAAGAELAPALAEADVLEGFALTDEELAGAKDLKWISVWAAGVEHIWEATSKRGILLTNASGVHGPNLAEHALAMMLMFTRQMPRLMRAQLRRAWERGSDGRASGAGELTGETLLIVGLGRIGEELAVRARPFGMKIIGVKRDPGTRHGDATAVDEVVGLDALDDVLPRSKHVVIYLPLTAATKGLFDARRLGLLAPDAYLYNLGRGPIVDERALVSALQARSFAGAGLDVFEEEPLQADSPLWELDNVILTPHTAGLTPHYYERTAKLFAENIARFLAGEPLANLFDASRGY
ncbi:MAG: D-3-phosphoglycerate dehydrogenase [Labilithrix sp.]|nr:D-3-phosphoglycerate dehydrogenase [Labilithrix sp.]